MFTEAFMVVLTDTGSEASIVQREENICLLEMTLLL